MANKKNHVSSLHNLLLGREVLRARLARWGEMGKTENYSYPLSGISPNEVLSDFLIKIKITFFLLLSLFFLLSLHWRKILAARNVRMLGHECSVKPKIRPNYNQEL